MKEEVDAASRGSAGASADRNSRRIPGGGLWLCCLPGGGLPQKSQPGRRLVQLKDASSFAETDSCFSSLLFLGHDKPALLL